MNSIKIKIIIQPLMHIQLLLSMIIKCMLALLIELLVIWLCLIFKNVLKIVSL
jgi:hypothetical protein